MTSRADGLVASRSARWRSGAAPLEWTFHSPNARRQVSTRLCKRKAKALIETDRARIRVENQRLPGAAGCACSGGVLDERSSDPSALPGRLHEEAAQVPEVLDQNDANDRLVGGCHQVHALHRTIEPGHQVGLDIREDLPSKRQVDGGLDDPTHQQADV